MIKHDTLSAFRFGNMKPESILKTRPVGIHLIIALGNNLMYFIVTAIHVRQGKTSPLLAYCEAMMSSVPAVGILPKAETSLECVKSALQEDRLDLVTHWIAQNRYGDL